MCPAALAPSVNSGVGRSVGTNWTTCKALPPSPQRALHSSSGPPQRWSSPQAASPTLAQPWSSWPPPMICMAARLRCMASSPGAALPLSGGQAPLAASPHILAPFLAPFWGRFGTLFALSRPSVGSPAGDGVAVSAGTKGRQVQRSIPSFTCIVVSCRVVSSLTLLLLFFFFLLLLQYKNTSSPCSSAPRPRCGSTNSGPANVRTSALET